MEACIKIWAFLVARWHMIRAAWKPVLLLLFITGFAVYWITDHWLSKQLADALSGNGQLQSSITQYQSTLTLKEAQISQKDSKISELESELEASKKTIENSGFKTTDKQIPFPQGRKDNESKTICIGADDTRNISMKDMVISNCPQPISMNRAMDNNLDGTRIEGTGK